MLHSTSLRIGNWVQAPLGEYMKVEQLGHPENSDYIFARMADGQGFGQNNFEGIPLSPEILEKCGFKVVNHVHGYSFYTLHSSRINKCALDIYKEKTLWMGYNVSRCDYLHQLQNLYWCLTGTELEYNP